MLIGTLNLIIFPFICRVADFGCSFINVKVVFCMQNSLSYLLYAGPLSDGALNILFPLFLACCLSYVAHLAPFVGYRQVVCLPIISLSSQLHRFIRSFAAAMPDAHESLHFCTSV